MLITLKIPLNIQMGMFVYRSGFKQTIRSPVPSKSLGYTLVNSYVQKLQSLTIAKFSTSTRIVIILQTSVKELGAITMCSTSNPDRQFDHSIISTVHCPKTMWPGLRCFAKKLLRQRERKTISSFEEISPPITINVNLCQKKPKLNPIMA